MTSETICMAASVYLLVGFSWALLYVIIFQAIWRPSPASRQQTSDRVSTLFPIFGYFSLTTLSTIGFGNITPVSLKARYAAQSPKESPANSIWRLVARLAGLQ